MWDFTKLFAGDSAPSAGIYAVYNANGTLTGNTVRIKKANDKMPPTENRNQYFEMVRL